MDGAAQAKIDTLTAAQVRTFLLENPQALRGDDELLAHLGLRTDAANVLEFGPAALARIQAAHRREAVARKALEDTARANFIAQAQAHAAVIDLIEAADPADLAARLDEVARRRLGLSGGVLCVEDEAPAGWRMLVAGQIDLLVGQGQPTFMGFQPTALGLFGEAAGEIRSMAMVRLSLWAPTRQGLMVFGSADAEGFTPDMGVELAAFLAQVVERTAGRWPAP